MSAYVLHPKTCMSRPALPLCLQGSTGCLSVNTRGSRSPLQVEVLQRAGAHLRRVSRGQGLSSQDAAWLYAYSARWVVPFRQVPKLFPSPACMALMLTPLRWVLIWVVLPLLPSTGPRAWAPRQHVPCAMTAMRPPRLSLICCRLLTLQDSPVPCPPVQGREAAAG